jgi:hypothetical protein
MGSILFLWETNSYEFGINFVTITIATKVIGGFNENEIGMCSSLMIRSLDFIGWVASI